jgi:hypothetical protein
MIGIKDLFAGGIKGVLSSAEGIIEKFVADPTEKMKALKDLEEAKINAEIKSKELDIQLEQIEAQKLESVNQTMRDESKSEHFMQWAWRPMIGFTFCAILINNYVLLPYFKNKGMEVITIPGEVFSAMLVILGVASAGRGLTKWQEAKK